MDQMSIDFTAPTITHARIARDEGMARVAEKAERVEPGFGERAYAFLVDYAASHRYINPEDVTDAAAEQGISTPELRAWGGVWLKAVKRGLVERSDVPYQRRYGHATESRLWRSLVCA